MRLLRDIAKNRILLLMALPATIYFILFNYLPMFGIVIAFKDFNYRAGILGSKWAGFKNFEFLFQSGDIITLIRNTVGYKLLFMVLGISLAVLLAIMFDALGKNIFNKINQTIVIMPHFISIIVVSYFVYSFLNPDIGFANQWLRKLGMNEVNWYYEAKYWPFILTFVHLWQTLGWSSVIYYANIRSFDSELYEAARIDGASWWQQVTKITLPLLRPTIILLLIMSIGTLFSSGIDLFYNVPRNSGALYSTTSTIDTYVYNGLLQNNNLGMSSATSFLQSVVGFVMVVIVNGIVKKINPEESMF